MEDPSIHDLPETSDEAPGGLPGPTAIRFGARTSPLRIPLKRADPRRLEAVLARAEALATAGPPIDDATLIAMGVDPTNWSDEAVRALIDSAP
jgi:hypothetical protein